MTVTARTLPLPSTSTSTTRPDLGRASDFQTPSIANGYWRPSIISKPAPNLGSRRILPRFFMARSLPAEVNQCLLVERSQSEC